MKKFKLLALAFVVATTSLFAVNAELPDVPVKQIRNQVMDLFEIPDFLYQDEMTVNVTFKFDASGKIIVLDVDSKNQDVLNYVRKNMNNKQIETPGEIDRTFKLPLRLVKK